MEARWRVEFAGCSNSTTLVGGGPTVAAARRGREAAAVPLLAGPGSHTPRPGEGSCAPRLVGRTDSLASCAGVERSETCGSDF